MDDAAAFDRYAEAYDEALQAGLRVTGEGKDYYAARRIALLGALVGRQGAGPVARVLDYGCGDGDAAPLLRDVLGAREVVGVDPSAGMRARAAARHPWATFAPVEALPALGPFDLAYCNGVLHHVAPAARPGVVRAVREALRPGALFGLWENNPWNPGTRWVMRRVAFDADAIPLAPPEARALLRAAGFTLLRTDHRFIFPAVLAALRPLERWVTRLPLGGQYQVLARRPA